MDFTVDKYNELLDALQEAGVSFQTFRDFVANPKDNAVILRHDVDLLPENSLRFAEIQYSRGIQGTYYFRAVPESWDERIILKIAEMGHEVGYHYETMDTSFGNVDKAWDEFNLHLENLRKLTEVTTICMHGSPRSKFDNRAIWDKYDYKSLGLSGEPYFDVNFDETFYLTDTGRRWDGWKVSVRDKVAQQAKWIKSGLTFHTTDDIIERAKSQSLPNKIMFTFHPQRWHPFGFYWVKELVVQGLKNIVKGVIIKQRA